MNTESEHNVRLKKLQNLIANNRNPFFNNFQPQHQIVDLLAFANTKTTAFNQETTKLDCQIAGRILQIRSFGNLIFAQLADHTGQIQLLIDKDRSRSGLLQEFQS